MHAHQQKRAHCSSFSTRVFFAWPMNCLTGIPPVPLANVLNASASRIGMDDEPTACSSRVHFSDSSYTLGFGQLFSGDLCSDVSVDACLANNPRPRDTSIDGRVNEAMETMRRTRNNIFQHSSPPLLSMPPTLPHQNTLDGNTCRQAGIMKAAEMLERAAHVISAAANASNNRCQ